MFYCEKSRVLTNSPAEQPRVASEEQLTAAEMNQNVQLQAAETIQNVQLQAAETDYSTLSPDAQEAMLPVEVFLSESYEFRFNVLSNKIEVRARKSGSSWRYVDKKTLNSIVVAARRALPKERALKTLVADVIYSDATPEWNPAVAWLQSLPRWDGIERQPRAGPLAPELSLQGLGQQPPLFRGAQEGIRESGGRARSRSSLNTPQHYTSRNPLPERVSGCRSVWGCAEKMHKILLCWRIKVSLRRKNLQT